MTHEKEKPAVGIDLGTTYSVIAQVNDMGRPEAIPHDDLPPEGMPENSIQYFSDGKSPSSQLFSR